jgi:hypothetical protein
MKSIFLALLFLIASFTQSVPADPVIFPMALSGLDSANQNTINQLFIEDYGSFYKQPVRVAPDSLRCGTRECAVAAGTTLGADEVVYGSARKLGEKWIVGVYRVSLKDGKMLASVRLDSKSVEDFEFAMRRAAEALVKEKSIEDVASIDNVTENEMSEDQHRRREGFYAFGLKFGYLFPSGSKSYQKIDRNYSPYSYSSTLDTTQYKQILITDWVNWFELPKDLVLDWDLHVGWGAELGTHFSLLKLFSRTDFAPYAGGGVGLDYVFPESYEDNANKRNSGFALNAKAGMLFFRTYSFRLMLDAGYKIVFNDDVDQGVTANLGIMWKKAKGGSTAAYDGGGASRNPFVGGLAVVGGIVVAVLIVGLVAH